MMISTVVLHCSRTLIHSQNLIRGIRNPSIIVRSIRTSPLFAPTGRYVDVADVAQQGGVRLTEAEIQLLQKKLDKDGNGTVLVEEFHAAGKVALEKQWAREFCLSAVEQPTTRWDRLGSNLLTFMDIGGKSLFAVVGTQMAGEVGMNLVGCVLVGCISCLGGGTLNNLLYGTSVLTDRSGVIWVRNPTVFFFAVAASVVTFFSWPVYCQQQARKELREQFGEEHLESDGSVGKKTFVMACEKDFNIKENVAKALKADPENISAEQLFDVADSDRSGFIEIDEMQKLVGNRFNGSSTMYALDTISLSAMGVTGVHMALTRGLNPILACTSGVTICFGGILRDVLCGRHLALGGQSYAMATGAGSTVYILLRELSLKGLPIPLVARIMLSAGTTIAVRVLEFVRSEPLLRPMHQHLDAQNVPITTHR